MLVLVLKHKNYNDISIVVKQGKLVLLYCKMLLTTKEVIKEMPKNTIQRTVHLTPEVWEKIKEHKEVTHRKSITNSISWLIMRYADQDMEDIRGANNHGT